MPGSSLRDEAIRDVLGTHFDELARLRCVAWTGDKPLHAHHSDARLYHARHGAMPPD